jgi:hypothetical protein
MRELPGWASCALEGIAKEVMDVQMGESMGRLYLAHCASRVGGVIGTR